jgi:hypothetical protein
MQTNDTPVKGRGAVLRTCETCGDLFRANQARIDQGYGRFCSNPCKRPIRTKPLSGIEVACIVCGATLYREPAGIRASGEYFCSAACMGPYRGARLAADPHLRFQRYQIVSDTGCYGWSGNADDNGYGRLSVNSRITLAHRYAWELATGETLSPEELICHVCDNPPCTRVDDEGFYEVAGVLLPRRGHLFKGTDGDNMRDMTIKGRHVGATGWRKPR